jgi:hypothetical protein
MGNDLVEELAHYLELANTRDGINGINLVIQFLGG